MTPLELTSQRALHGAAQTLADPWPACLAAAEHLANTVIWGDHGRRRAGQGDDFWQYRPAQPGDPARSIDWRRSARADQTFVQDKEWQISQAVQVWVEPGATMAFGSHPVTKGDRARILTLALTLLLLRGGERVGVLGAARPKSGRPQIEEVLAHLKDSAAADSVPVPAYAMARAHLVLASDFFSRWGAVETLVSRAADAGALGTLLMVLDPEEVAFPFRGRTVFESPSGAARHETQQARDLQGRYLDRLAARQDQLAALARATGWRFRIHQTDHSAAIALRGLIEDTARRDL